MPGWGDDFPMEWVIVRDSIGVKLNSLFQIFFVCFTNGENGKFHCNYLFIYLIILIKHAMIGYAQRESIS
jgi:hypothetical protein